jgi:hypothetical protein
MVCVWGGGGGGAERARERKSARERERASERATPDVCDIIYLCINTYVVCLCVHTTHDLLKQLPIKLGSLVEVLTGKSQTSVLQYTDL